MSSSPSENPASNNSSADPSYDDPNNINDEDNFIDLEHAVEVGIDTDDNGNDDVPMDDEEDEDMQEDDDHLGGEEKEGTQDEPMGDGVQVQDMSVCTLVSHKPSSVFTVDSYLDEETNTLSIVSGGGDDKAYLHKIHDVHLHILNQKSDNEPTYNNDYITSTELIHNHTDSVSSVATNQGLVSNDLQKTPKYVAVGAYDGNIALYNPESGDKIHVLDGPTDVEFVAFHPKGGSVLLAGSITDATVWMYHLPTSKCLQVFVGHECNGESGGVTGGCFTPDGKFALTIGMDGSMRIWAPRTGICRHVFKLQQQGNDDYGSSGGGDVGLTCLAVDGGADGQLAVAGGVDGAAYVVHLQGKKVVAALRHYDINSQQQSMGEDEEMMMSSVEAVGFASKSVNPNWVATGGSDGKLKIWDLTFDGGQCRQTCQVATSTQGEGRNSSDSTTGGVTRLKWHPTLPLVIATYSDASVRLWDARNGTLIHTLTGGYSNAENQINDVSVVFATSRNGTGGNVIITTGNDNGECKVFNVDVDAVMMRST